VVNRFGEYLKDRRVDAAMTQKGLAQRLRVSPQYLCDIEQGHRRPTRAIVEEASLLLELDPYEAHWMADLLPARFEALLFEAGPLIWRSIGRRYGALADAAEEGEGR
jgi:transcriptional regulator with XRE-family HTH domain